MLRTKMKWNFLNESMPVRDVDISTSLTPITLDLLHQRGLVDEMQINAFISPNLANLNDASDIHMIDVAAERVHHAIKTGEKILVFGDYDADGVCSTTVMMETLQELGANCDFYIPNRFTEGYGPNEGAFHKAVDNGFTLIITVDTGIAAIQEIKVANELGLDVIITDHHEIQEHVPDAYAIIHPKCSPDYTFKELAGVGVAFKFATHLLGYFPVQYLDIVAIGTIADMVSLLEENRILAYFGLRELSRTDRPGLRALMKLCQLNGPITEENVGFMIAPRLNAVGRLQDASLAVHLLMTKNEQDATEYA
ncbi:MAG TPA: DHH family phosphoesterase, partial [Bacillota bacterium]|nr:DHH family phosphoesterase [Bacillota bacterium]